MVIVGGGGGGGSWCQSLPVVTVIKCLKCRSLCKDYKMAVTTDLDKITTNTETAMLSTLIKGR